MTDVRILAEFNRIIVACLRTRPEEDFFSHYAALRIEKLEAELRQALAIKPDPGKTIILKYWRFRVETEAGDVHYLDVLGGKCGYDSRAGLFIGTDQAAGLFIGTDQDAAAECDRRVQLWENNYGGNGIRAVYESRGPV